MCISVYVFLLIFTLFPSPIESSAKEMVTQETRGANSPAQYIAPGGTGTINYKIDAEIDRVLSEVRKEFTKCLEMSIAFQDKKLEELNITLAGLLVQNQGSSDDSKKWAKEIIEKAPEFKKEIEHNNNIVREYNETLSKELIGKVYRAFAHIFETVDSRLQALKDLSPGAIYEMEDKFILFSEKNTPIKPYTARSLVFANGNHISVILSPGTLKYGLVKECPSLNFVELSGQTVIQSFKILPEYGGSKFILGGGVPLKKEKTVQDIEYRATGGEILTDKFMKNFDNVFAEFVKLALAR